MTHSSTLSPARRKLVELMQRIGFGEIENLLVRNGEPVIEPKLAFKKEHKLGHRSLRMVPSSNFELKEQHLDLFARFEEIGDGLVERVEIQGGLPFKILVSETLK